MAMQYLFIVSLFILHSFFNIQVGIANAVSSPPLSRSSFPKGFLFGAASAAYQYEGAAFEGGRGPSIWDTFTHKFPGKIIDGSTGNVAEDFYHRYKEDVQLMKYMGLDAFRLSISWSRILPRGKLSGGINKEGIAFYNNLINELLSNGIQPFVTLFHWDLPQALEDEYLGFLNPQIVNDFRDFAELCFKEFGDRVKHWITLNEPYIFTLGYDTGLTPPGRCSKFYSNNCTAGNSATEPYIASHHLLLCHAAAVKLYREKYKASQNGEIGITLVSHWMVPYSNKSEDIKAAKRALDFMYGWYMNPLLYGTYPSNMQRLVGKRLPEFTAEQVRMVKGSFDFLGLNYYTANYAAHAVTSNKVNVSSSSDSRVLLTTERNGKPIGDPTGASFFFVYPQGLEKILIYTKETYNVSSIYITENGIAFSSTLEMKDQMRDAKRINFFHAHLTSLQNAIKAGVNVKGYFAWSFLDTFEWASGYTLKFGFYYVDYKNELKRYPKDSALWFRKWLTKK